MSELTRNAPLENAAAAAHADARRRVISQIGGGLALAPFFPALAASAAQQSTTRKGEGSAMSIHSDNKRLLVRFLHDMASGDAHRVLADCCHADCRWEIFHPFNTFTSLKDVAEQFWLPLRASFPDYEQRIAFAIGGDYEGRTQASTLSHVMGTFDSPWLGIPPTRGLTFLRFGFNAIVREGKISKAYILLDIVDVMRQAGFYPFRPMPGSAELWPFPPCDTGATANNCDPLMGAETMRIVREMQVGLPKPEEIKSLATYPGKHSPHWHENMNWCGPAGIGSMRGRRGFRDYHGALFLQAFPDRTGWVRNHEGPEDAPGHYVRVGDGRYAVTGGWPSLHATHLGGEWLGLPPSGRHVEMRVADWYRLDENNKIIDNWVLIDIPHIVKQMGMDIFHDLKFRVDRATERLPEVQ